MNISHLIVHVYQIEKENLMRASKEVWRINEDDNNSSKIIFEVQGKPKFNKRFSSLDNPNNLI